MVEDENPPAYDPVPLEDTIEDNANPAGVKPTRGRPETVSSSVFAIDRLLRAHGGFLANFRGLSILLVQGLFTVFLIGIFTLTLGGVFTPIATLLASLALIQYSTAWVHIVISQPSPKRFWQRLPPYKRTFDATWKAVTIYWAASELKRWLPYLIGVAFGIDLLDFNVGEAGQSPEVGDDYAMGAFIVIVVSLAISIFVVIPAHIVLVRVQASLLPVEEDTIIPFDRSFRGAVTPAIVGGPGYATVGQAWSTLTRAAWRRIVFLYAKLFALIILIGVVSIALILPQIIIILKYSNKVEGSNP